MQADFDSGTGHLTTRPATLRTAAYETSTLLVINGSLDTRIRTQGIRNSGEQSSFTPSTPSSRDADWSDLKLFFLTTAA